MLVGPYNFTGSNICVTLCDKRYLFVDHRVVIEHEVAIGVVIHCLEREVGCLGFGSVCTFDTMYSG